jgi:hypothetical protein
MLTARYFEAYLSGAVVCGIKPSSGEFDAVLHGLPFVEYRDAASFAEELKQALANRSPWIAARNEILRRHTWTNRAQVFLGMRDFATNAGKKNL